MTRLSVHVKRYYRIVSSRLYHSVLAGPSKGSSVSAKLGNNMVRLTGRQLWYTNVMFNRVSSFEY